LGEEKFNIENAAAFVNCFPRGHCDPTIPVWLIQAGLSAKRFMTYSKREYPIETCYNLAIKAAIENPVLKDVGWFIFSDNDMILGEELQPWFSAEGDVVGVTYDMGDLNRTWGRSDSFHSGLWRARRDVLERVHAPWFDTVLTDDGCDIDKCCCEYFARKVRAYGYTITRAGWAGHGVSTGQQT